MGSRLDKLRRLSTAATQDELPAVTALKSLGLEARRNDGGGQANRALGDVIFTLEGEHHSLEIQVVGSDTRYNNFSYSSDKVDLYVGSGPGRTHVLLGCYEERGGTDMIYCVLSADVLHDILRKELAEPRAGIGIYLNKGDRGNYFVIRPEALATVPGTIVAHSIATAMAELVSAIRAERPRSITPVQPFEIDWTKQPRFPPEAGDCTLGQPLSMVIPPEGAEIHCPAHGSHRVTGGTTCSL